MSPQTRMFLEAAQAPDVVRAQLASNAARMHRIGAMLRELSPRAVVTCARGSSDHAATFAKYLIESRTQGADLLRGAVAELAVRREAGSARRRCFSRSRSRARSPDLLASAESGQARRRLRGRAVQLGRLAARASSRIISIPLYAGVETSVAATKSYIASLSAIVHLVASWTDDRDAAQRADAVRRISCEQAWTLDWSDARRPRLQRRTNLFVVGRGFGLGSRRKRRSNSKKRAVCMRRRSAPRRSGMVRWRSSAPAFRC